MPDRRTVITGMGCVSPLGIGSTALWNGLVAGRSGIRNIRGFDSSGMNVRIAGEAVDFPPEGYLSVKESRRLDRGSQFVLHSAEQAVEDAGIELHKDAPTPACTIMGTGMAGALEVKVHSEIMQQKGPNRVSPLAVTKAMPNAPVGTLCERFGLTGPSFAVSSACASANHAIGEASLYIRSGCCDVALAGGVESALAPLSIGGFASMKALSTRNDEPETACRPFDLHRDGFVMSEGAGVLVLEEMEHARRRGARIYAEILGYGSTSDAYHICLPHPDGLGAAESMRSALQSAGVSPQQVSYINAHGTGTKAGDMAEARALCAVFGDHAKRIPVSSTKSMIGHLLGASGVVELISCLCSLQTGVIHPTANLETPDPECLGLDYVPLESREAELNLILSNSFGFGGHNASLLIGRA